MVKETDPRLRELKLLQATAEYRSLDKLDRAIRMVQNNVASERLASQSCDVSLGTIDVYSVPWKLCGLLEKMNLLKEYEFDCLPYIDREYENPMIKQQVTELIMNEMKSFHPNRTYIEHLPYPQLKFAKSQLLQNEMVRVANKIPMEKIDISKYEAEKPEGPLEKDIQAWRRAITNAKIQLEYQEDRLMNLELADSYGGPVWLHANAASEGAVRQLDAMTANLRKKCDEIHIKRRLEQENAYPSLNRMTSRANETVMKTWQIHEACVQLESDIKRLKSSHNS